MSQDITQPDTTDKDGKDAGAVAPAGIPPQREPNGTPVDLGSHNPDPHAHEWLHPEADLATWDSAFDTAESAAADHSDDGDDGDDDDSDTSHGWQEDRSTHGQPGDDPDDDPSEGEDAAPLPDEGPTAKIEHPTRQRVIIGVTVVLVLAAMAVTIGFLVNMLSSGPDQASGGPTAPETSASPQPLPRNVNALEFQKGDCFADFDSEANSAMAVACDTAHSAQLVAVHRYPAGDDYPGRDALKAKAQDVCKGAQLTAKSNEYALKFQLVYPSPTSWDKGDRRVDCFIVVDNGNTITENLVK